VENAALRAELTECHARVRHLERWVADFTAAGAGRKATPQNSSLPPSAAPKPAIVPKGPGRARKGRPGAFRRLAAEPDAIQERRPEHCPNFGSAALTETAAEDYDHIKLVAKPVLATRVRLRHCRCAACGAAAPAMPPADLPRGSPPIKSGAGYSADGCGR